MRYRRTHCNLSFPKASCGEPPPLHCKSKVRRTKTDAARIDAALRGRPRKTASNVRPAIVPARRTDGSAPVVTRELWLVLPSPAKDVPRIRAVADWLASALAEDRGRLEGVQA